ncbi:hypothetical protein FGO68_gene7730 [Halteria grandinella]|uniref:Uncharacterized protein n=1 Tax=Halteria grandinella TaxID=5974 RepID=A0A8J8T518_HALGN|nr:hypothetical protein FGO68_gene7730 [Halteria grandinella]
MSFALSRDSSSIDEYVVTGRNDAGDIIVSYIHSYTSGAVIQQYDKIRKCKTHWKRKCWNEYIPRALNIDEIMVIQNGLLSNGYGYLLNQVEQMRNSLEFQQVFPPAQASEHDYLELEQSNDDLLKESIEGSFIALKNDYEAKQQSQAVERITKLGFKTFQQDMEIFYIKNLLVSRYPAFIDNLLANRHIPVKHLANIKEFFELTEYMDFGTWQSYRAMYSATNTSETNYLCILASRSSETKISIYMAILQNSFELAPDLLILKSSKSSWGGLFKKTSTKIVEVPHLLSPDDLDTLCDFFDLIAMQRFMDHFQRQVLAYDRYFDSFALTGEGNDTNGTVSVNILDVIDKSIDIFKKIFSSSKKSEIIANYTSLGFDRFEAKTNIISHKGIKEAMIDKYLDYIARQVEVPANKKQAFLETLQLVTWMEAGTWNLQTTSLTPDNSGVAKSICLMHTQDQVTGKYTFFTADTQADFHVGNDMFVWRRQKSKMGGTFTKDEQSIEYRPHRLSIEDVEVVMTFFDLIALKKYRGFLAPFNSTM